MINVLVVLVAVLLAAVVLLAIGVAMQVSKSKRVVAALEKKIAGLESQVKAQGAAIARIEAASKEVKTDPIFEALELLTDWKKRGPVATILAIGARVFRSYSVHRRAKASAEVRQLEKKP